MRISVQVLVASLCAVAAWGQSVPVVLSTDVGNEIDDQWAIAYLLTQPAFDVRGILSAHAPSLPAPAAHATFLILRDEVEKKLGLAVHPPLFEGSSVPLRDVREARPSEASAFLIRESRGFGPDRRLQVLTIGAATDVASALLEDATLADRIQVVAMAFTSLSMDPAAKGAKEYNVENDVKAWQVVLDSRVPLVIGTGDVCRQFLALNLEQAKQMVSTHGAVGRWLWLDFERWYYARVKPLRVDDFSKSWFIWDVITLAFERGLATVKTIPRPRLGDDVLFQEGKAGATAQAITGIDSRKLWDEFVQGLDEFQRRHAVE